MSWAAVIVGGATLVGGAIKTASANKKAKRAQNNLQNLQTPKTESSQTIDDYYRKASASPQQTAMYKMNDQNIDRSTTQGIDALQTRHAGLAGIGNLIRAQNDAKLRNNATATQYQDNQLNNAIRLKAGDDQRVFNINQLMPYDKLSSMYAAQAAGANQQANAGWSSMYSGAQTTGMGLDQYFKSKNGGN